jgi:hypothetical protein
MVIKILIDCQSRPFKPKIKPLTKPKTNDFIYNPVKKRRPQKKSSKPTLKFNRPLPQRRKINNNQAKITQNNKNQSKLLRKSF